MKKINVKSFILGIVITILIMTMITTVFAAQLKQTIEIFYRDIKITVDGIEIEPKDATGKVVEPFISDGSTYLPVRAVAEAVGYDVKWDGDTSTVILTKKPQEITVSTPDDNNLIVFWGNAGNKVHIDPDCRTIINGVLYGTLEECKEAGHTEGWCGVCSQGWDDEKFFAEGNPNAQKYYDNEEYYKLPANER